MWSSSQPDLGLYIKVEKLGAGQLGTTWIYRIKQTQRKLIHVCGIPTEMAVKEIKCSSLTDDQEAGLAKIRLNEHKNILRYLKTKVTEEILYIATDVAKMNLAELRRNFGGKFALEEFMPLAKQIYDGLHFLHSVDTVHGKIHPHNIMIMSNCSSAALLHCCMVKLSDYGLGVSDASDLNVYAAPELVKGECINFPEGMKSVDIFSAGVVFHEMMTANTPFSLEELREASETPKSWRKGLERATRTHRLFGTMLQWSVDKPFALWSKTMDEWMAIGRKRQMATSADMDKVCGLYNSKALHKTAADGNVEDACWLIDSGDDVNRSDDGFCNTPLSYASWNGHLAVAELLIKSGADVDRTQSWGWTPLHMACHLDHPKIAELVLANGANINAKTNDGLLPFHIACRDGHIKLVHLLIEKGVDVHMPDENGWTPLHHACNGGHLSIAELLLEKKADVNVFGNDGKTPWHFVCEKGQLEIIQLLFKEEGRVHWMYTPI